VLNAIFGTQLTWQTAPWQDGLCDRMVLSTYRSTFPQLWQDHDLIVDLDCSQTKTHHHPQVISAQKLQLQGECYVLRLFVAGHSVNTRRILENLHELLERSLGYPYTMKVIDVLTNPEQAEIDQVSATPTLVKVWPQPIRRIVGDIDNVDKLLQMLGATEKL
jgi:circadian clock protein KaiB